VLPVLLQDAADQSTGDDILDWLAGDGARIVGVILVALIVDLALHRVVPRALRLAVERQLKDVPAEEVEQRVHTLSSVFTGSGRVIITLVALLTLLPLAGISIGPLLAGAGIVGLAVGFGAQSLVKDVISGLFILLDNQYSKGDVVTVGGVSGLVEDVGLRRTVLRDLDGAVHYIPNGEIAVASNLTQEYSRVNLNVGVSYSEDLDHVMAVINRVGAEMAADAEWGQHIITPPSCLRVDSFGDSRIDLKIVGDTQPIQQWAVMGELRRRLKIAFDREGIEIPYPHQVQVTRGAKAWDIPRRGEKPSGEEEP
jgi:small conductance mechanosensitive channel